MGTKMIPVSGSVLFWLGYVDDGAETLMGFDKSSAGGRHRLDKTSRGSKRGAAVRVLESRGAAQQKLAKIFRKDHGKKWTLKKIASYARTHRKGFKTGVTRGPAPGAKKGAARKGKTTKLAKTRSVKKTRGTVRKPAKRKTAKRTRRKR